MNESAEVAVGSTVSAKATKAWPTTATVTYVSDKPEIATVDAATGEVTGVAAGEATITATLVCGTKTRTAATKVTVKEAGIEMTSLTAAKVNTLVATFASAVTDDVVISVTKGTNSIAVTSTTWNAEKTEATIVTTAKMTAGTYTVKAVAGEKETAKDVVIEDQKVSQIVVKDTVALTTADQLTAYAYYDVLDQYGESLRNSTTIQWSGSCVTTDERSKGRVKLTKTNTTPFTYNEQIYLTGVYTKTGVNVQATLTVGSVQSLDAVSVEGFVAKNTSEIVDSLPAGFKSGAYYMLFNAMDQNGDPLDPSTVTVGTDVTFVSDNVLVIKEITGAVKVLTIDGNEYAAVLVTPGQYVDNGGVVGITAIANKTGKKTPISVTVGEAKTLVSFKMSAPSDIIADGESVEIPFTALDASGAEIKDFDTLADNINALTFTTSSGDLKLEEKNDGSAVLKYYDNQNEGAGWCANSEDGVDRPISLTSVVVSGDTDNQIIYIKDRAMPDAIKAVNIPEVMVEGAADSLYLSDFTFVDQYGRTMESNGLDTDTDVDLCRPMGSWKAKTSDHGFFSYVNQHTLSGTEFNGYKFGIGITYKGSADALASSDLRNGITVSASKFSVIAPKAGTYATSTASTVSYVASSSISTSNTANSVSYEIVKNKDGVANKWNATSTTFKKSFDVVDIKQVKNFVISDIADVYVETNNSTSNVGPDDGDKDDPVDGTSGDPVVGANHDSSFNVTGTYNGKSVKVPANYITATGKYLKSGNGINIDTVVTSGSAVVMTWNDLYDFTTSKNVRKALNDTLNVTIKDITNGNAVYEQVSKNFKISDAAPYAATISAPDAVTLNPNKTDISNGQIAMADNRTDQIKVYDQYGVEIAATETYSISKITENANGYAANNATVSNNGTSSTSLTGMEIGDTFVLTVKDVAGGATVTKDITVTVGSDVLAVIANNTNTYKDTLIDAAHAAAGSLEAQRQASLQ